MPMRAVWSIALFCWACQTPLPREVEQPSPYASVNVFQGTGGSGFSAGSAYPGATRPFGMVRLSPDTNGGVYGRESFAHFAGYWYHDTHIEGFSHTHLHGTGAVDYGNISFMPTLGMDASKTSWRGYSQGFTHTHESAQPGYYRVRLADGIEVELTATLRTGLHRYHFPAMSDAVVVVDFGHSLADGQVRGGDLEILPAEHRLRGWILQAGGFSSRFGGVPIYFDAVFSRAWTRHGVWVGDRLFSDVITATAPIREGAASFGGFFHFDTAATTRVEAVVGLSFVSVENAAANRKAETAGMGFDEARAAAQIAWEDELSRIQVHGGSLPERRIFYTSLYHAFQMPTLYSDVDGSYRFGQSVRKAAPGRFYSDMSLWDTYRTLHPLLTLIAPEYQADFIRSLAAMAEERGALPRWPMAIGDGNSMVGTPADIVIADSFLKGIGGFDAHALLATMVSTAVSGDRFGMRECRAAYWSLGYCPSEEAEGAVSITLENMYADFAIGQMAAALGETEIADRFGQQARRFDTLWDPTTGFFRGRKRDGSWSLPDFDPKAMSSDYIEGNAWQYLWLAPWNADKLMELLGGREQALKKLDDFFRLSMRTPPSRLGHVRLPDPYYWHGNEPDIHAAYLYILFGAPERAAPVIRWIARTKYADSPDGRDGNDDGGTLAAWYVFSAMGIYPLPGETRYLIGSPLFKRSEMRLGHGKRFIIEAPGLSSKRMYVRRALWNGRRLTTPWIEHSDIRQGGVLRLEMADSP